MSKGSSRARHAASRASTLELAPRARADRASVTWHARASGSQMSARRTVNTRALSARRCEEAALREGPLARAHLERDLSPRARRSRGTAARARARRSAHAAGAAATARARRAQHVQHRHQLAHKCKADVRRRRDQLCAYPPSCGRGTQPRPSFPACRRASAPCARAHSRAHRSALWRQDARAEELNHALPILSTPTGSGAPRPAQARCWVLQAPNRPAVRGKAAARRDRAPSAAQEKKKAGGGSEGVGVR